LRFLVKLSLGFLIILIMLGVGDFMNMPLWPFDLLKTRIPVEIVFELHEGSKVIQQDLIKHSGGIRVVIASGTGNVLQQLESGLEGIARTVLPVGRFKVRASLTVVHAGEWFNFTTVNTSQNSKRIHPADHPGDWQPVTFSKTNQTTVVKLYRIFDISKESLWENLRMYLQEGDLKSALVISKDLESQTYDDVKTLEDLVETLHSQPISAYNSCISILESIHNILQYYCPDAEDYLIQTPDEKIHLRSRIAALRSSRNKVVRSYIDLMEEFLASGRLEAMLEEWNLLTGNPEIYPNSEQELAKLPQGLKKMEAIISDTSAQLAVEIEMTYSTCVELYENGELSEARTKFTRLLAHLRNLNLQENFYDLVREIHSYIDDIALIAAANEAIRNDNLEHALDIFDIILHPNDLVLGRIRETKRFLEMRATEIQEGQLH